MSLMLAALAMFRLFAGCIGRSLERRHSVFPGIAPADELFTEQRLHATHCDRT